MFNTLRNYIVKIKYNSNHVGSGTIIKNNKLSDSFYIFTAKHVFFNKEMEISDMKVNDIVTNQINIENPCLTFKDDIELEVVEINKEYDFLIIKVSNCKIEKELPTNISMDEMNTNTKLYIMGFPYIRDDKKTKYDSYPCTYKHICENEKHFEIDSERILTVRDREGNANHEISGLSGSGVYLTNDNDEKSIVGILIESATGQGIVCFDLRKIIGEINKELDIPIQLVSSDGLKPDNEIDTAINEYHLTIECIPKNEKFEVTILHNNRMKSIDDRKTYTKNEIAILIDNYVKENKPKHIRDGSVFLLFVLPISLMSENIGSWKVGEDRLADKYTIMLRGQERFRNKNKHLYALNEWKLDWKNCISKKDELIENIICKKYKSTDNIIYSQEIVEYPLIVFGYNIDEKMLEQLYRRGVSKAIWVSKDAKFDTFRKLFKKKKLKTLEIRFGELHNKLHHFKKKEKKIGSHIMFLYDNPYDLPLDDSDIAQITPII